MDVGGRTEGYSDHSSVSERDLLGSLAIIDIGRFMRIVSKMLRT